MSTRTPSLRRRVTVTVLGLFALLLILIGIAVDIALGAQLRRDLDTRLADRAERAVSLAESGTAPEDMVATLNGPGIRVRLTTADGRVYGDPGIPAARQTARNHLPLPAVHRDRPARRAHRRGRTRVGRRSSPAIYRTAPPSPCSAIRGTSPTCDANSGK